MFDLAFYNMITKSYKIMTQNVKSMWDVICRSKDTYFYETEYVSKNSYYLHSHVSYFTPRSGLIK